MKNPASWALDSSPSRLSHESKACAARSLGAGCRNVGAENVENFVQNSRRFEEMSSLVQVWANINSHTQNHAGVVRLLEEMRPVFRLLKPDIMEVISCGSTLALFLKKRKNAQIQIYLGGHLDTVFPSEHPFQEVSWIDERTLKGPGVTDMKGGLVVLLKAVEQFETLPEAERVGWEIFINSDEEIGSPESTPFIADCAKRCDIALLFEPTFADGALVAQRKGSANYSVYSKGKKAHAGRESAAGKHAIYPLARLITEVETLHAPTQGTIVNVGTIKGGEALNIIPDYAECGINIRSDSLEGLTHAKHALVKMAHNLGLKVVEHSFRSPKPLDAATEKLLFALQECGSKLGLSIKWRESGGVCDGNIMAAAGVPTIDTLGVRGGDIHTENEYLELSSLTEKTDLTILFLQEIARGNIPIQRTGT